MSKIAKEMHAKADGFPNREKHRAVTWANKRFEEILSVINARADEGKYDYTLPDAREHIEAVQWDALATLLKDAEFMVVRATTGYLHIVAVKW